MEFHAFTRDGVERLRMRLENGGQRANQHVLPLALLQGADREEDDATAFPSQLPPALLIARRRLCTVPCRRQGAGTITFDGGTAQSSTSNRSVNRLLATMVDAPWSTQRVRRLSSRLVRASVSSSPCA